MKNSLSDSLDDIFIIRLSWGYSRSSAQIGIKSFFPGSFLLWPCDIVSSILGGHHFLILFVHLIIHFGLVTRLFLNPVESNVSCLELLGEIYLSEMMFVNCLCVFLFISPTSLYPDIFSQHKTYLVIFFPRCTENTKAKRKEGRGVIAKNIIFLHKDSNPAPPLLFDKNDFCTMGGR